MEPHGEPAPAGLLSLQPGPTAHRGLCWHLLRGACCLLLGALLGTALYGYSQGQVEAKAGWGPRGSEDTAAAPWPLLGHRAGQTPSPAAHLVGHPHAPGEQLSWRSDLDASFTRGGFHLANGSLVVPATGTYFVYFQLSFLGATCPPGAQRLLLAHRVLLLSDAYARHVPLLSAHSLACPGKGPWHRALREGAAFTLRQGDQLSTHTEGEAHLLWGQGTLAFGAFAL
ncbi:lymphotoxin-alpha [Carettochelys insculpta]|uniref:lymphotoxin-alpha n=1 Tax=Carettochelys insculpta TaxID=44489 RepID=UPI003EBEEADA